MKQIIINALRNFKKLFNRRRFHFVREVLYGIVATILIMFGILIIMSTFGLPSQFRVFVVQSGSMEPIIRAGSIIFVIEQDQYTVDDVITFSRENREPIPVTHRIVEIVQEDSDTFYITKGDANETPDPNLVKHDQILGRVRFSIPYLGYPISFAKTPVGFIILIVIPATLIIQSEARTVISETKNMIQNRRNNVNKEESANE